MNRVLVTGGGGFLGRAIVERLLQRGEDVRILNRSAHSDLEQLGVEVFRADLTDTRQVIRAGKGCKAIFHVAAKAGVWGAESEYFRINVEGTRNVLTSCRQNAIPHLIYTSTPSVVFAGKPILGGDESLPYPETFLCAYPKTKVQAEREVLAANRSGELLTVALRPHLLWGPGDPHLIPRILGRAQLGKLRQVGDGRNLVDITYIDNAADAHLLAWDALKNRGEEVGGRPFFISQGEPVCLWEWVRKLLGGFELELPGRSLSFSAAYRVGATLEWLHRWFAPHKEPLMTRFVAHQLAHDHYFSNRAARELLGYVPQVSIEEGLKRVWSAPWPVLPQTVAGGRAK
jgi:nucleoside-diphosphate-sugar epimerase